MVGTETRPRLGLTWEVEKMGFLEAVKAGGQATWSLMVQVGQALMNIFRTREGFGGPLMVLSAVTQFAGLGFKMFLFILALISVNLAVFNVLPLPIFDGGQVLFFTIEALTGKPLSDKARENIHYYTWLFVIILAIYLTLKDALTISKWF
jgi:regulator of sigma E protease